MTTKTAAEVTRFSNLRGGETVEVRINNGMSTAAYVDTLPEGGYTVEVFDPATSRRRTHHRKTLAGAQSVLDRHMDSLHAERVTLTEAPAAK